MGISTWGNILKAMNKSKMYTCIWLALKEGITSIIAFLSKILNFHLMIGEKFEQ